MTKNQKKRVKNKISKLLTVGELKEFLNKFSDDLVIGVTGHFGELHEIDLWSFSVGKAYVSYDGSWRDERRENIDILQFPSIDLGPDPD